MKIKTINFIILTISLLILNKKTSAQLEDVNWVFGQNAWLNFSLGSPVISNGSLMNAHYEGCTSISDECGNLLFYSEGTRVWGVSNGVHSIIQNGTGLFGNSSATQTAVIIKNPNINNIYYIVTVDSKYGTNGVNISTIDRNLNGGQGGIISTPNNIYETSKNTYLLNSLSEKICYYYDCNNNITWLVLHDYNNRQYLIYKIDQNGISTPTAYPSLANYNNNTGEIGQMKFSNNGSRFASAFFDATNSGGIIEIMDFNPTNGNLSSSIIDTTIGMSVYGLEFSPNNNFLYYSILKPFGILRQINLSNMNDNLIYIENTANLEIASLQIARNNKIYVTFSNSTSLAFSSNEIGVINNPNISGVGCNFNASQILLPFGMLTKRGLPNFSNNYCKKDNLIVYSDTCFKNNTSIRLKDTSIIADSVKWNFGDLSSTLNIDKGKITSHIYTNPGTYNITSIIYKSCYNDTINTYVTIKPLPIVNLGNDTIICSGSLILNTSFFNNHSYIWQDNSTNQTYTASNNGTFHVSVTDTLTNCYNSDTINIELFIPTVNSIIFSDTCFNNNTMITLIDTNIVADSIIWDFGDLLSTFNIEKGKKTMHKYTAPGTYNIKTIIYNFCYNDTLDKTITINPLPLINIGNDTIICSGNLILDAKPGINFNYLWQDNSINQTYSASNTGQFHVTVTNTLTNCFNSDTIEIENFNREIYLGNDTSLCIPQTLILTSQNNSVLWSTNATSSNISVSNTGTYWVKTTYPTCNVSDTINVVFSIKPDIQINDTTLCLLDSSLTLIAGQNNYSYLWSNGDTTNSIKIINSGLYSVITSKNGCSAYDSAFIDIVCPSEIYLPNSFTPNGDGINDVFIPVINNKRKIINFELSIFNRWGELIFETSNLNVGWNGKHKSAIVKTDIYVWKMKYTTLDKKNIFKIGHVSLLK